MNKQLWMLEKIADRLWETASALARAAATAEADGRGVAVVADEARKIAVKVNRSVEGALFGEEPLQTGPLVDLSVRLSYLALNTAIESSRLEGKGKVAAVCADEIRNLSVELIELLGQPEDWRHAPPPVAADPMTSLVDRVFLLHFTVGGLRFTENLAYVREVLYHGIESAGGSIVLRDMEIPVINFYPHLGKKAEQPSYVILRAHWAGQNATTCAVACDDFSVHTIFASRPGKPIPYGADQPLAGYVREAWEATDGEPFRFAAWDKLSQA